MLFVTGIVDENNFLEIFGRTSIQNAPDGSNQRWPEYQEWNDFYIILYNKL